MRNKPSKVLVTGGAGLIGSEIVRKHVDMGDKVIVVDNLSTGSYSNLADVIDRIDFYKEDAGNQKSMKRHLEGVEKVYHMAATVGVDLVLGHDREVAENDYLTAKTLFELSSEAGVGVMLFASTSEAYGKFNQKMLPMKEDAHFTPDTVYGFAKYAAELELRELCRKDGMCGVSVRYFNVYGPKQTLNGYCVPTFIDAALRGKNIQIHAEDGKVGTRDLTYLSDAVNLTVAVADEKYNGEVFNIGTGNEVSMIQLAEMVTELARSESQIAYVQPRRETDLYRKMGDASKILNATGLKAEVRLVDGLRDCVDYWREHRL